MPLQFSYVTLRQQRPGSWDALLQTTAVVVTQTNITPLVFMTNDEKSLPVVAGDDGQDLDRLLDRPDQQSPEMRNGVDAAGEIAVLFERLPPDARAISAAIVEAFARVTADDRDNVLTFVRVLSACYRGHADSS
jgi:hypothetical protein